MFSAPQSQPVQPDIPNWTWHEYGMRVGFWRIKRVLVRRAFEEVLSKPGVAAWDGARILDWYKKQAA
jgi:allantoinase